MPAQTRSEQYTLLLCAAPDVAPTLNHAFSARAYHVVSVPPEQMTDAFERHQPDAIIAPLDPATARLFRALHKDGEFQPPVRALLPPVEGRQPPPSDIILGQDAGAWAGQLLPLLRMRAQIMALRAENDALHRDIEVLRQAPDGAQALRELDALKSFIVNIVKHELKTPLLQVKGAVANLREELGDHKLIQYAVQATARLEGPIQNISQVAQSLNIELDAAMLGEAVDYALRSLRNSWRHSSSVGRIEIALPSDLPLVLADKRAIGMALQLLIDNGLKFSENEQRVRVTARREGDLVRVSVRDWGIGIAADQFERIFELFVQGDPTSTRRYDGAGVGLSLARMIIERHHSTITLESTPGKGSTFSFTLAAVELP